MAEMMVSNLVGVRSTLDNSSNFCFFGHNLVTTDLNELFLNRLRAEYEPRSCLKAPLTQIQTLDLENKKTAD